MAPLKRSRPASLSVGPAAPSRILFIALHDASYVPEFLEAAETAVLRRCLPSARLQNECEDTTDERPWERVVRWKLDGIPVDSFGAGAVQIVLEQVAPEKVYLAVEECRFGSFSARAQRSFYDVACALSAVKAAHSRHVYFAFPPIAKHAPDREVLNDLRALLPASGFVDGDVSSIVFQARATWVCAKRLDDAARAAADSLRSSVRVYAQFRASEKLPPLSASTSVDEAAPGLRCRQRVIWSGSIAFPNTVYRGFELVDLQSSGDSGVEGSTLRFPPGTRAVVVGHDDQRVVLGAFAFTAPRFEIRPCAVSEMIDDSKQPMLHLCASLLVAVRESKRNLLLTICDSAYYCSWRWVRSPMSLQYSWMFVATEVPHPSQMGASILDLPSFRRVTLGLVGRTPIFSARSFLSTLPFVDIDKTGSCPPRKHARFRVRDSHEEVAELLMSRRQPVAFDEKQIQGAEARTIRKLCRRKTASISAPERKLLKRWDEEREEKRKRAEAKGVDDASLIGASSSQKNVRVVSSLRASPAKQVQKDPEDDPAAVALRNRRSVFWTGSRSGIASNDSILCKPLTAPKHRKHLKSTVDRPKLCGSRSLPSHLFALSSNSSLPVTFSCSARRTDQMKDAMSLTNFLDSLTPFREKSAVDASLQVRPNGFSIGLSPNALRWQELVPCALSRIADESSNFYSVEKWDRYRDHGMDPCIDRRVGLHDPVENTVREIEEKAFIGGSDHKSAFPFVSRRNHSQKLLDAVKFLVHTTPVCAQANAAVAPASTRSRQLLSSEGVAEALASIVLRNKDSMFDRAHLEWLPGKIRENALRFHLPEKLLLSKRHCSETFAFELLKGRQDCGESVRDGLFVALVDVLQSVRDGDISLHSANS